MLIRPHAHAFSTEGWDPAVVPLCNAINAIPGLQTYESCEGHGRQPFKVWFEADSIDILFPVARPLDCRYGDLPFTLSPVAHDMGLHPVGFLLESREVSNPAVLVASVRLAEAIQQEWEDLPRTFAALAMLAGERLHQLRAERFAAPTP